MGEESKEAIGSEETSSSKKVSLVEMAEVAMSQSMLIFLLADLRILSSTGNIRTKFESLCLDNDHFPRLAARDFAGYVRDGETHGVTAAHIMAVLILEITREAEEVKKAGNRNMRASVLMGGESQRNFALKRDAKAASNLPSLLHCYNEMVFEDITTETHSVRKADYPMDRFASDAATEDLHRADFDPDVEDQDDERIQLVPSMISSLNLPTAGPLRTSVLRRKVATKKMNTDLVGFASTQNALLQNASPDGGTSTECYSQSELVKLMERAIEKRDNESLGFVKTFFKEGSVSGILAKSKAEMVWLSDYHASHECTYAISIDRETKNILLSFRGAYTKADWAHAMDFKECATSNPIKENYPNRPRNIRIHRGFHQYLFRVRKDTETTKYDEICARLIHYGKIIGDDFMLRVTGHSLGAALSTVFSFYASAEERFTKNGAIEVVTFGAPLIGGYKFADAFRHQEDSGKLRLAKFRAVCDGVAYLPPTLFKMSKRGAKWFHSGINVTLPMIRKGLFKFLRQPLPTVTYNGHGRSFMRSYYRQLRDFYLWNIPWRIWLISKMHTLVEHKKRINLINKTPKDREQSPLVRYSLEELYEMRDQLRQKY